MSECRLSTQYRKFPCLCNRERSPFSAWVHFALAAAEGARRATGAAANGARREADRERRTVRGHLLRGNIFSRAIPRSSEPGISDIADDVAVRAAVFGCATLSHPRRTERPFRHLICDQDAPSMRLGRSSSAGSARASCAAWFDRTNAPRALHPGAAWGRRADRSLPGPAGVAGATKNKLRRRRMGVISPPRFFLRFFLREGKDARGARGAAAAPASAAPTASRSP